MQWREGRGRVEEVGKGSKQDEREVQREVRRERKQLEKMAERQREVEEQIGCLEGGMGTLSERISVAGERQEVEQVHELGEEYRRLEEILAGLWREWEELGEGLDEG